MMKAENKKIKRSPTNIPGFDEVTEGGLKKRSINIIAGGAGTGKSIFSMQFLVNGAVKNNENGIYISFEQEREQIIEDMSRFGWNIDKLEKEGKVHVVEYMPEQVKKLLAEGGGVLYDLIKKINAKRLVVDSINSFTLMYGDKFSKKKACLKLFEMFRKWGCTTILSSEDEAPLEDDNISSEMEFEADSLILMYHVRQKGKRIRALEIAKMRGTKHLNNVMELDITSSGLRLNTKKKVVF